MSAHGASGETRLRESIRRRRDSLSGRTGARRDDPRPYDDDWGWWIEQRLNRLETGQRWLLGLALSTLAAELIRVITSWWS